ncbi:LytR/AlgR family response regulator transcription factor [Parachitinimonas caeni]|uniref:LytTR family DNA-binding domain-containing protein n=1 Tax=Parachitinimonas caeni TaxID=3031301 RepID=A0ABT7DV80_9NEIS|nr:LytTR family DNA-binding domain-containing protein [Parachitinimonas caeni]MDK2123976.1 LytTR family DNA-binding domain-containing protein [Parachitinimonas caeni]
MNPKILIAEDEPLMRERLSAMLRELWPEAQIVVEAENGNDAWDGFLEHEPDVVFLDIRMPGLSGLEVAERIGTNAHQVFVTAYDQYAVDAFDTGAVDYLLKPVQVERLEKTIERIKQKLTAPPDDLAQILSQLKAVVPQTRPEKLTWIKASVGKQIKLIHVDDILFFQSDTKYTRIVLTDFEALVRTPLKDMLEGLDPDLFWQIHRGTVVNARQIAAAERLDAERMQVLLKNHPEKLPVSRAFTHLFKD